MSLDRATVEQWLEHAESEGAQLGPFAAVCESWLRQEEALQRIAHPRDELMKWHDKLEDGGYVEIELPMDIARAALADRPQAEEEKPGAQRHPSHMDDLG